MAEFGGQLGGDLTGVRLGGTVAAAADAGGADAAVRRRLKSSSTYSYS